MTDSEAQYVKVSPDGVDSQPSTRSRKVGIALLGGSCLVVLSVVALYASGATLDGAPESTNLLGLATSLRSPFAAKRMVPPTIAEMASKLPGPSPWKELALAGIQDANRCDRDISPKATAVTQVLASLSKADKAMVLAASQSVVTTVQEMKAGQTAPMGLFDPLGLATKASPGKLAFYREAEIKHGRVCMLASVGYIYGELFHPLFGGDLAGPSYKWANAPNTDLKAFWGILFVLIAIPEAILSIPTLSGFGEAKTDRIPGDLGFDPLDLKTAQGWDFLDMQNKEINNGRLAMFAWVGMIGQEMLTGKLLFPDLPYGGGGGFADNGPFIR